jgi:hypothetical protein
MKTRSGDEDPLAISHQANEVKLSDSCAVRPAPREIRCPVYVIVERAGKTEVVRYKGLDRYPILVDIGSVASARDRNNIVLHVLTTRSIAHGFTFHALVLIRAHGCLTCIGRPTTRRRHADLI